MIKNLSPYMVYDDVYISDDPVAVQVGSYDTDVMDAFLSANGGRGYIYEACTKNYKELCERGNTDAICIHKAVGLDGTVTLFLAGHKDSHSIYESSNSIGKETVVSVSIGSIINEVGTIDILLLNCEGAETFILDELSHSDLHNRVRSICVGMHSDHVHLYSREKQERILNDIGAHYTIHQHLVPGLEYFLLCHK